MKKTVLSISIALLLLLAFVFLKVGQNKSLDDEKIDFTIIMNSSYFANDRSLHRFAQVCNFDAFSLESAVVSENPNLCYVFQLESNDFVAVDKKNNGFELSMFSSFGCREESMLIEFCPEKIIEYNDMVIVVNEDKIYNVDFTNKQLVFLKEINEETEILYSSDDTVCYKEQGKTYLYYQGEKKYVGAGVCCLGKMENSSLLLSKELFCGFVLLYQYDYSSNLKTDFKILYMPGYIRIGAVSNNGRYLFCYSSNGEGRLEPYLIELKSLKKIKFDFDSDTVDSVQWSQSPLNTADTSVSSDEK